MDMFNGYKLEIMDKLEHEQGLTKNIYIPIFGISYGELMILYGDIYFGLAIRLITLLAIIIKIISKPSLELETKNVLQSLILLILLQVINLSMPRLLNNAFGQHLLIYSIMILPIYSIIKSAGLNFRKQVFYIFAALSIGTITNIFEYGKLSTDIVSANGDIMTIFLIILLSITLLVSDTKYWNRYISDTINICSNSLILTFIVTLIFKVINHNQ